MSSRWHDWTIGTLWVDMSMVMRVLDKMTSILYTTWVVGSVFVRKFWALRRLTYPVWTLQTLVVHIDQVIVSQVCTSMVSWRHGQAWHSRHFLYLSCFAKITFCTLTVRTWCSLCLRLTVLQCYSSIIVWPFWPAPVVHVLYDFAKW